MWGVQQVRALYRPVSRSSALLLARISVPIASNAALTRSRSNVEAMARGWGKMVGATVLAGFCSQ